MRRTLDLLLIAVGLLGTLATPLADDRTRAGCDADTRPAASDIWPGWRGGTAQGNASGPLPIHWSADQHIRWKTAIPGRGHSSPVVYGDRVYVTTADVTVGGVLLEHVSRLLTLGLVLVVASLVLRLVIDLCRPERATSGALAAGTFQMTVALALVVMACCGDELFDLARSPIRGWIVSIVFASLCLTLTAVSVHRDGVRWIIGLSAITLAVLALAAFPFQRYTFYRDFPSVRPQIAFATAALPMLVGVASVLGACSRTWLSGTRRIVMAGLVLASTVSAAFFLDHLLAFRDDGFTEAQYVSQVNSWLLVVPLAWTAAWLCRGRLHASLPVHVVLVAGSAISIAISVASAIEFFATHSPYLAYQHDRSLRSQHAGRRDADSRPAASASSSRSGDAVWRVHVFVTETADLGQPHMESDGCRLQCGPAPPWRARLRA
jgi:PQQ-like domain